MALNFNKAEFVRSAGEPKDFLRDGLPQFAFAGRSNVLWAGKIWPMWVLPREKRRISTISDWMEGHILLICRAMVMQRWPARKRSAGRG